jgi:hypothetical protein
MLDLIVLRIRLFRHRLGLWPPTRARSVQATLGSHLSCAVMTSHSILDLQPRLACAARRAQRGAERPSRNLVPRSYLTFTARLEARWRALPRLRCGNRVCAPAKYLAQGPQQHPQTAQRRVVAALENRSTPIVPTRAHVWRPRASHSRRCVVLECPCVPSLQPGAGQLTRIAQAERHPRRLRSRALPRL